MGTERMIYNISFRSVHIMCTVEIQLYDLASSILYAYTLDHCLVWNERLTIDLCAMVLIDLMALLQQNTKFKLHCQREVFSFKIVCSIMYTSGSLIMAAIAFTKKRKTNKKNLPDVGSAQTFICSSP